MTDPFHEGEVALQELSGERDKAILNGRLIGSTVPLAAHAFLEQQTACSLAWLDESGSPWATFVEGSKGFASSSASGDELSLDPGSSIPALQAGVPVGLLFIELETRRRLRVNGTITARQGSRIRLSVTEAFPNCPKYIQKRAISQLEKPGTLGDTASGTGLPSDLDEWLRRTDTMFVASAHPERGVDCSHRGGTAGFMRLASDEIRIPDYPGNSMFGTLGNISVNPAAGLCLLDFENRLQLQLTGHAALRFGTVDPNDVTGGTGRWWTFKPIQWALTPLAASREFIEASPHNPTP